MTASENIQHAWDNGLKTITLDLISNAKKIADGRSIKILQYDLQGNVITEWKSATEAGKSLKIKRSSISACCRGERKTAGGFGWKYKEEK